MQGSEALPTMRTAVIASPPTNLPERSKDGAATPFAHPYSPANDRSNEYPRSSQTTTFEWTAYARHRPIAFVRPGSELEPIELIEPTSSDASRSLWPVRHAGRAKSAILRDAGRLQST